MAQKPLLFDPTRHGFVLLKNYDAGNKGMQYYEYANHPCVDGAYSWLRSNYYLSIDPPSWCWVWHDFLIEMGVESMYEANNQTPPKADNRDSLLFKGYIESDEQAAMIFKAFRMEGSTPSVLRPGKSGRFEYANPDGSAEERMRPAILQAINQVAADKPAEAIEQIWQKAEKNMREHGHAIALDRDIFDREIARLIL